MRARLRLGLVTLLSFAALLVAVGCGADVADVGFDGATVDAGADVPNLPGGDGGASDVAVKEVGTPDSNQIDTARIDTVTQDVPEQDVPVVPPPECDSDDDCDDDDECTADVCGDDGTCAYSPTEGYCHIDGACYEAGVVDPENPCRACAPAEDDADWSADDTLPCGEDDECSVWSCQGGVCVARSRVNCDDGNPCTEDRCEPGRGCAYRPASGPCDDGNRCTQGDQCVQGLCTAGGETLACDDRNDCTFDECDPSRGCVFTSTGAACDDGDACTRNDRCTDAGCVGQPTGECDDGNPCTEDHCHEVHGCVYTDFVGPCDDGDPCTVGDRCIGRVCVPGGEGLACDDGNPCTDDVCVPGAGCSFTFNTAPCDDGDECTSDDACAGGSCVGSGVACDDGDPCTEDSCDLESGCTFTPRSGMACDDGRVCTTGDVCTDGVCGGAARVCDDGNGCTVDRCVEPSGCASELGDDPLCALSVVVTEPARGVALTEAQLQGGSVRVRGYVESPADPSPTLALNGQTVTLTPAAPSTGPPNPGQPVRFDFTTQVSPEHAMNLLRARAEDSFGRTAARTQSFYYSTVYTPVTANDFAASRIPAGVAVGLSQAFVDDNDATLDDLASLVDRIIASLDIMSLIPSPAASLSELGCAYDVYLTRANFSGTTTDVRITNDGLLLTLTLRNLDMGFRLAADSDNGFWCPGTQTGSGTATAVVVNARLLVTVVDGQVVAALDEASTSATLQNLNVSIDNWFVDLIVGFFEGTIKDMLEEQIAGALRDQVEPLLATVFEALLLDVDIDIPSFFPGGQAATVSLRTAISGVSFVADQHMTLEMDAAVLAANGVPYASPGALGYANCLRTPFTRNHVNFGTYQRINLGLFDDVANQILHAAWTTGAFELTLGPDVIPVDQLEQFGVAGLDVDISLLLPPVLTGCKTPTLPGAPADAIVVEMGDMRVDASFTFNGAPVDLTLYASLSGAATLGAATNDAGGAEIGIEILGFDDVVTDLVRVETPDATTAGLVTALIDSTLVPLLLDQLDFGGPIGFALPVIDLSNPDVGIPDGTAFAIVPSEVYRTSNGNTIAKGYVAPPAR